MAFELTLQAASEETNLADFIDEGVLLNMGREVYSGYEIDEGSRSEWVEQNKRNMKLALQVMEQKNMPIKNASNVKYPLLTISSLQFAARAYQTLLPNANIVRARVIGEDPDGAKERRATRISKYMSYERLEEDEGWEDSMDRLCITLPILGNVFKKTYRDNDINVSEMVLPQDLVVNYYAKSIEKASRKTHILSYYPNDIEDLVRAGEFVEHDYKVAVAPSTQIGLNTVRDKSHGQSPPPSDADSPIEYLEQHRYWDLDDDGYQEPYVITIHKDSQTVVRVTARYEIDSIKTNQHGEVYGIKPVEYFTNFIFIPDPLSGVYGLGFGTLLGPLNEASNTLINLLIDAGKYSNLQAGFIGRGIRTKMGEVPLGFGEWRYLQTSGDDIRKNILPLPSKEPSQVLFTLLGMLVESGFNVGSVAEIMMGKNPGQNQPFSTTSEVLKQGMQLFSAIHKRIHRALKKEYIKLYRLNRMYLDEEKYFLVLDPKPEDKRTDKISPEDFRDDDIDIIPASDPTQVSSIEKLEKSQMLLQLVPLGTINPAEATKRILENTQQDDIPALMKMPDPQPNFDQQIEFAKIEIEKQKLALQAAEVKSQSAKDESGAILNLARAEAEEKQRKLDTLIQQFEMMMRRAELQLQERELEHKEKIDRFNAIVDAADKSSKNESKTKTE